MQQKPAFSEKFWLFADFQSSQQEMDTPETGIGSVHGF
jgi:hypothetical protein